MRRCRNLVSGEICEYFIFGVDEKPEWYGNKGGWFDDGSGEILVHSKLEETIFKFSHDKTFSEKYEAIDLGEQPSEADEDESTIIVEKEFDFNIPCCRYKATGEIFEYFVYHSDESPYMIKMEGRPNTVFPGWYDGSLNLVDGDVIVNHEGKGYVIGNSRRPEEMGTFDTDYEICGSIDRMFQYLDHR